MTELFRKFRPTEFAQVFGQDEACALLSSKLESCDFPHTTILVGPTGSGKTTLARIVAGKLGCVGGALSEVNVADDRGIELARNIQEACRYKPMSGKVSVWILDEVVQLPAITQKALLKTIEEPPDHVYFIFCTTEIAGLLPTFLGRCFHVKLKNLEDHDITKIVMNTLRLNEGGVLSQDACKAIVRCAQGNARQALLLLEAALTLTSSEDQVRIIEGISGDQKKQVEFLARALIDPRTTWQQIAQIIVSVKDQDLEGLRLRVLGYMNAIMLKSPNDTINMVIGAFWDDWFRVGRAGLTSSCWKVYSHIQKQRRQ